MSPRHSSAPLSYSSERLPSDSDSTRSGATHAQSGTVPLTASSLTPNGKPTSCSLTSDVVLPANMRETIVVPLNAPSPMDDTVDGMVNPYRGASANAPSPMDVRPSSMTTNDNS